MLKELDGGWTKGTYLLFQDQGLVNEKAVTKKFAVYDKPGVCFLGYIKWFPAWRRYCYHATEAILDYTCMMEIAEFMKLKTDQHRQEQGWKKKSDSYRR